MKARCRNSRQNDIRFPFIILLTWCKTLEGQGFCLCVGVNVRWTFCLTSNIEWGTWGLKVLIPTVFGVANSPLRFFHYINTARGPRPRYSWVHSRLACSAVSLNKSLFAWRSDTGKISGSLLVAWVNLFIPNGIENLSNKKCTLTHTCIHLYINAYCLILIL